MKPPNFYVKKIAQFILIHIMYQFLRKQRILKQRKSKMFGPNIVLFFLKIKNTILYILVNKFIIIYKIAYFS
jgi:hypothetical protein